MVVHFSLMVCLIARRSRLFAFSSVFCVKVGEMFNDKRKAAQIEFERPSVESTSYKKNKPMTCSL